LAGVLTFSVFSVFLTGVFLADDLAGVSDFLFDFDCFLSLASAATFSAVFLGVARFLPTSFFSSFAGSLPS
jgi:hypothetical protein